MAFLGRWLGLAPQGIRLEAVVVEISGLIFPGMRRHGALWERPRAIQPRAGAFDSRLPAREASHFAYCLRIVPGAVRLAMLRYRPGGIS